MELISVIIPAYNAEKTIRRAIESLLSQTYSNIEIIVVNDGSSDRTEAICLEIMKSDHRVQVITIENGGVSNARNIGLDNCHGKYITFLDADDYVKPEFINSFASNMNKNVDLVCSGYTVVSEKGDCLFEQKFDSVELLKDEAYRGIEILQEAKAFNVLWNKMFRKSIIDKKRIHMDTHFSMGEDLLFVLEYLEYCSNSIRLISDINYNYVLSKNGLQATFKDNLQLRLIQLERIEELYKLCNYQLDGFYLEALRTFYVILMEKSDCKVALSSIIASSIYQEMRKVHIHPNGKFRLFWIILNTENDILISIFMNAFQKIKRLSGKSYRW